MTLHEWIERQGDGEITRLVRVTGCAASTIHNHLNGRSFGRYETARKFVDATGGEVSIDELCSKSLVENAAMERGRLGGTR